MGNTVKHNTQYTVGKSGNPQKLKGKTKLMIKVLEGSQKVAVTGRVGKAAENLRFLSFQGLFYYPESCQVLSIL